MGGFIFCRKSSTLMRMGWIGRFPRNNKTCDWIVSCSKLVCNEINDNTQKYNGMQKMCTGKCVTK